MKEWKKIDQEVAYDGYRSILHKTFELPNGKSQEFDIVDHTSFATVAALTTDSQFIVVKQFRPGPETFQVGFPSGHIDPGENPELTATRELLEETGFSCKEIVFLKRILRAYSHGVKHCFVATGCEKVAEPHLDDTEFLQTGFVSMESLRNWLRDANNEEFHDVDVAWLALDYLESTR